MVIILQQSSRFMDFPGSCIPMIMYKAIRILLFLLCFSFAGQAQPKKQGIIEIIEAEASVDTHVWKKQLYTALRDITDSLQFLYLLPPGKYSFQFEFVVNKDGRVSGFTSKKDPGYLLLPLLEHYLQQYPVIWKPATRNGQPVISRHQQSIFIETFAE